MVRRTGSKGYSYLWGRPNPVSSPQLPGIAGHCTEMIYTTGLYLDDLSDKERQLSIRMVDRWILFAYGCEPWEPRQPDGYDLTVAEDGTGETRLLYRASEYRRVEAQEYIVQNIDKFGAIFRDFLEGSD